MLVETFDKIGVGHWFRYVTGGIEVISAILLLIPRLSPLGAALLACTTVGAVLSHLVLIDNSPPVQAMVMLSFTTIILWGRFGAFKWRLLKLFALARAKCRETAISPERRSVLSSRE
jgi:putative oxidoreductase